MISLPVSIGEALDKLSILEIKIEKLPESRKKFAQNEYDCVFEKVKNYVENNSVLYGLLKTINLVIWDEMDLLRDQCDSMSSDEYNKLCKKCIDDNDKRFKIKNKINNTYKSQIKEQKSYIARSALLLLDSSLESIEKLIQYFSFVYDNICVAIDEKDKFLIEKFSYDNDVTFAVVGPNYLETYCKDYKYFIYDDAVYNFEYGIKLSSIDIDKKLL